jgi:hypothetical protein
MKRYLIIAVLTSLSLGVWAQNEQDALRLSYIMHGGSARTMSMGGAFGALGGDFGALSINPAGIGLYRQGDFSFTPDFSMLSSESMYLGSKTSDSRYKGSVNQFGFVIPFKSKYKADDSDNNIVFGFGYNKLRDFSEYFAMKGINNSNSLVDDFVYTANMYDDWDPFTDGLAWETYLIDTVTMDPYSNPYILYYSDFDPPFAQDGPFYGQEQLRTVSKKGAIGEYLFSLGANLGHKLYVGGSLGIQRVEYEETWVHTESDPDDIIYYFNEFSFRNKLYTTGRGINVKLGFIARPMEWLRVGGAIHTPTFFSLNDDFTASMSTDLDDGEDIHESEAYGEYSYDITTPFRAVGSVAFILKQMAILSLDYEYVDYSSARLRADDYDFFDENQAVSSRYKAASNLRLGGEVHFGPLFLRAGYSLYGSPYVTNEPNNIQVYQAVSGGLGYRTSGLYIDLGVVRSGLDQKYFLYGDNSADLTLSKLQFLATVGFRF